MNEIVGTRTRTGRLAEQSTIITIENEKHLSSKVKKKYCGNFQHLNFIKMLVLGDFHFSNQLFVDEIVGNF